MNAQKYTLLKVGDTMVGGLMPIPEDAAKMGARPAWMGYIAVDDVKKYADKVKAAGGVIHRPPTEIPNVGTFAIAGDPSGAGFLLFKGEGGEAPMQEPMKPGHIGWHELHGGDPEKSFAFYSSLFGWTKGEALNMGAMGTYQIFSTKGQQSGGMMKKMDQEPMAHWLYYISVDAIDAAQERMKSAGLDHQRHRSARRDVRACCAQAIGRAARPTRPFWMMLDCTPRGAARIGVRSSNTSSGPQIDRRERCA
jgi:predicted enzyme related to lactoylglutathione lyase